MRNLNGNKGAALLVVLFMAMAVTILAMAYISQSDVELACGQNMQIRTAADYVAESGLEHARGLILRPQEVSGEYWTGATGLQIAGGYDFYDLDIARDDSDPNDRCNYIIDCNSYRVRDSEQIGGSNVSAELRLDPCIALWLGAGSTLPSRTVINGDVYSAGYLQNLGTIRGDVFAGSTISGTGVDGRRTASVVQPPVDWPSLDSTNYWPVYYIGSSGYSATTISSYSHTSGVFPPTGGNPAGVRYRASLAMLGSTEIQGTLVVGGDLTVGGTDNVITAQKNFPAMVVEGDLYLNDGTLEINGLALIEGELRIVASGASLSVTGGLYVMGGISELAADNSGQGAHGKLYAGPTWRPTGGRSNGALEFDGVDDRVATYDSDSTVQFTGDYTVSCWVKADATQKDWAGLLSKTDPTGTFNHWSLVFDAKATRKLLLYHPTGSWDTGIPLGDLAGAWHHVAVIRSGDQMKSYRDGNLLGSGTWADGPGSGNGHLNIGSDCTGSADYVFKGLLDEVRIYNQAHDVNNLYPATAVLPGLVGEWLLDGSGSGITVTASPCKAAIMVWTSGMVSERWEQAGGAFFKAITRR